MGLSSFLGTETFLGPSLAYLVAVEESAEYCLLTFRQLESSSSFKSELLSVWFGNALGEAESCRSCLGGMAETFVVDVSVEIRDTGLGGGSESEGGGGGDCPSWVLALVLGLLGRHVGFLGD